MKTGFNQDQSLNTLLKDQRAVILSAISVIARYILEIAETWTLHSNRSIVTKQDIHRGMKVVCNSGLDTYLMQKSLLSLLNDDPVLPTQDDLNEIKKSIWTQACQNFPIISQMIEKRDFSTPKDDARRDATAITKMLFGSKEFAHEDEKDSTHDIDVHVCECPRCVYIANLVDEYDKGIFDHDCQETGCIRPFVSQISTPQTKTTLT